MYFSIVVEAGSLRSGSSMIMFCLQLSSWLVDGLLSQKVFVCRLGKWKTLSLCFSPHLLIKPLILSNQDPDLITSFIFNYLLKHLSLYTVILRIRASACGFWNEHLVRNIPPWAPRVLLICKIQSFYPNNPKSLNLFHYQYNIQKIEVPSKYINQLWDWVYDSSQGSILPQLWIRGARQVITFKIQWKDSQRLIRHSESKREGWEGERGDRPQASAKASREISIRS